MEFSFDRSRNSNPHSETQASSNQAHTNQTPTDEVDTSGIANERLRKAIERNRERQRQREQQAPASSAANAGHSSAWAQHQAHTASNPREEMENAHVQSSLFERSAAQSEARTESRVEPRVETRVEPRVETRAESAPRAEARPEPRAEYVTSSNPEMANHSRASTEEYRTPQPKAHIRREANTAASPSQVLPTRRSVAKSEDTEFAPVKRTTKKAASQISYTTGSKKKAKELDPKLVDYLVKGSWLFCGFLVLRLIFANGGITDFFSQRSTLNARIQELARIKNENMSLVHDIERMQLDAAYQKRLVRDNLGFIAQDEFLILFPKDQ